MARLTPINVPSGIDITINGQVVSVKGSKGTLEHKVHEFVKITHDNNVVEFSPVQSGKAAIAQSGTACSIINNMITGVANGFERKLELVGVGYRAQSQGKVLNLTLGFSHPVEYQIPEGITIETPSQTEVIVKGMNKQVVGQVAADIRAYRPPEPYKGKGVKYSDEHIVRKEAKKK